MISVRQKNSIIMRILLVFDAISVGGVLAWLMDCLDTKLLTMEELGVTMMPVFLD